ncbi:MAG: hypothetical protein ACXAB4_09320 [Candidatus Hodarchaeales archaeon]|jgi:heme/copper-type cytochrome/quinol oxidase subunit 2
MKQRHFLLSASGLFVIIHHVIEMEARIKPWVFNITAIDGNPVDASKYTYRPEGLDYPDSVVYTTLELQVGLVYKISITAVDIDHGVLVLGLTDYWGEEINVRLPIQTPKDIYIKPTEPGNYTYLCNYFCGQEHGYMQGKVIVSPTSTSAEPVTTLYTTEAETRFSSSQSGSATESEAQFDSSQSDSVNAPLFTFFLLSMGILGYYRGSNQKSGPEGDRRKIIDDFSR